MPANLLRSVPGVGTELTTNPCKSLMTLPRLIGVIFDFVSSLDTLPKRTVAAEFLGVDLLSKILPGALTLEDGVIFMRIDLPMF